jgi:hypothetical protein
MMYRFEKRIRQSYRFGPSGFLGQSRRSCRGDVCDFVKNRDENSFGNGRRSAAAPAKNRDIGDRTFVSGLTKRPSSGRRNRDPLGMPA